MSDSLPAIQRPIVVGIGEVLFDYLPDRAVLGGAPINLAVHAHRLLAPVGGEGVVVSRVGDDDLGKDLLRELAARNVVTNLVQVDAQFPTGTVNVEINGEGDASYHIAENVAWDHIQFEQSLELLAASSTAVCFGSLAQRCTTSATTIHRFLAAAHSAVRLFDVNLRQDFFTASVLTESFRAADVVKLNQDELSQIADILKSPSAIRDKSDLLVQWLADAFRLRCVALTRGQRGTILYHEGDRYEAEPPSIESSADADSVGAGDACAAGLLCGLLNGWEPERTLELGNRMGAFVASQPGATPQLPDDILEFAAAPSLPSQECT